MKKITLTLMLLALVGSSSDLCAAQSANKTKSSMMSRMYSAASGAAKMGGVAAKGMYILPHII